MRYDHFSMLPEKAFQPRNGRFGMTLEGGKGKAPAPDPNIGLAQRELAALSREQLTLFKNEVWPTLREQSLKQEARSDEQFALDRALQDLQIESAKKSMARYEEFGYPLQEKIFAEAEKAGGAEDQEKQAALALGDVRAATDRQARNIALEQRSFGIDPSSGRYQGMLRATGVDNAAMEAAAANRARTAAEQLGWAKRMDAAALVQGQFGNQATSTGLALNAGNQALMSGQIPIQNAGAMTSNLGSSFGTSMQGWNQVGTLGVDKYKADVAAYSAKEQAAAATAAGFGQAVGTVGMMSLKTPAPAPSDRRLKTDIQRLGTLDKWGIGVYSFKYIDAFKSEYGDKTYIGVMADEVEQVLPEAVVTMDNGYKAVNYEMVLE